MGFNFRLKAVNRNAFLRIIGGRQIVKNVYSNFHIGGGYAYADYHLNDDIQWFSDRVSPFSRRLRQSVPKMR